MGDWVVENAACRSGGPRLGTCKKTKTVNWFCSDQSRVKDQVVRFANAIALGSAARLEFRHAFETEANRDGGVLEYSTDGGTNWFDILEGNGGRRASQCQSLHRQWIRCRSGCHGQPSQRQTRMARQFPFLWTWGVDLGDMAGQNLLLRLAHGV